MSSIGALAAQMASPSLEDLEARVTRIEKAIWGEEVPVESAPPEEDPVAAAFVRFRRRMERGAA